MNGFEELGISKWLCKSLLRLGIKRPSIVQRKTIPLILSEKRSNIFVCSRTGTGKTLTYILPIIENLLYDPIPYYAIILSPTRELSQQIYEMIQSLTINTFSLKILLLIGGEKEKFHQNSNLWTDKPNIVVATPGRLLDHLLNRNFSDLYQINELMLKFNMLILDEADQLISNSFCKQLKMILNFFNKIKDNDQQRQQHYRRRQTLLFSATLTDELEKLQKIIMSKNNDQDNKPIIINLLPTIDEMKTELLMSSSENTKIEETKKVNEDETKTIIMKTNATLDQRYILCPEALKIVYLIELLLDLKFKQLIIFCRTKYESTLLYYILLSLGFGDNQNGYNPVLLNSNLKQSLRFVALEKFRSLRSKILITTDIVNRGIDLPHVDLIVNFNCPRSPIVYIHRVGRTCRRPDFTIENIVDAVGDSGQHDGNDAEDIEDDLRKNIDDDGEKDLRKNFNKREDRNNEQIKINLNKEKNQLYQLNRKYYLGKSITFITQYDIELFKSIENYICIKMMEQLLDERNVKKILKQVKIAVKEAEIRLEQESKQMYKGKNKKIKEKNFVVQSQQVKKMKLF